MQLTPSGKGATWMSARMLPACHLFKVNGREQILVVGGRVFNQQILSPTPTAVVIEIPPGPPVHSHEADYEKHCTAHLAEKTREAGHDPDAAGGPFLMTCSSAVKA